MSSHLTYLEASVVGLIQGVTELFPVSSLGHNVLIPALIGGSWGSDLSVAKAESPYLAFIVGLHAATAIALLIYFWRDWIRIAAGFFTSVRHLEVETTEQKLAWMVIRAAIFLVVNGVILYAGERFRTRASLKADADLAADRQHAGSQAVRGAAAHASGQRAVRQLELSRAVQADERLAQAGFVQALVIGSAQILALLAGISRDGVTMVAGMARGLSREDAARFAFLLATPVILAAGVLKYNDLIQKGHGIYGPIVVGSIMSGLGAYVSVRYLVKYFQTRTLTPFAIYCVLFGTASIIYLSVK